MSKKFKIGLAILITLGIGAMAFWQLKLVNHKAKPEAEINIKEAVLPLAKILTYEDWAGFKFDYPESLKIEEVEIDDKTVYSSLELTAANGEKLNLKVADTEYKNIGEWQKEFEKKYLVTLVKDVLWEEMAARQLVYGAPKRLMTMTINNGVIYSLDSLKDEYEFWEKTQNLIVNSFMFTQTAENQAKPAVTPEANEDIVLLEETIE